MPATTRRAASEAERDRRITVATAWLTARVVVAAAYLVARSSWFDRFTSPTPTRSDGLLLWDGTYYRDLVGRGYAAMAADTRRFFPAYHLVSRAAAWVLGGHTAAGLVVVSNLAALAAMWLLHVLVTDTTGDRWLASRSVWWLALFPAGPVLVFAYGESLALALSLAAVVALRRRRLALAAALAWATGLTRPTGLLLSIVVLGELVAVGRPLWRRYRSGEATIRDVFTGTAPTVAVAAAPVAGTLTYLVWLQARFGTWRTPIDAQREFRGGWHEPVSRLVQAMWHVVDGRFADVFNVAFAVGTIVVLVVAARRLPAAWTAYVAATLLVASAATNINSLGRYALGAFPLAVAVAATDDRFTGRRPWPGRIALAVSAALSALYAIAAWSGRMIP